jgi:hypothetical protein
MASKEEVKDMRTSAIFAFCSELHDDIDTLYEVMVDGTDEEEKVVVETLIEKIKELNTDR